MNILSIISKITSSKQVVNIINKIENNNTNHFYTCLNISNNSLINFILTSVVQNSHKSVNHLYILNDKEEAAYAFNDLENIASKIKNPTPVYFFPKAQKASNKDSYCDNTNILLRAETLTAINSPACNIIITYPEALSENVLLKNQLESNTLTLNLNEQVSIDFLLDLFIEYKFERVDYVYEPGQFSIRGGIIDVFSFANEHPYRIELFDNIVDSIRTFDATTQLSLSKTTSVEIIPNVQNNELFQIKESFLSYLPKDTIVWIKDTELTLKRIEKEYTNTQQNNSSSAEYYNPESFIPELKQFSIIETDISSLSKDNIIFNYSSQPIFNKKFDLILNGLIQNKEKEYSNYIFSDQPQQIERITTIFNDINKENISITELFTPIYSAIHEGFVWHDIQLSCFTDHQLFDRYHRFKLKEGYTQKEAITLKELLNLNPGDFVTHIDHGIGKFDGLEKIEVNGKQQEAIRLIYKDNDILYVSVHSLHRITKYTGKEGNAPKLHRLGSNVWKNLKDKTKDKIKTIAIDLIRLYAERRSKKGYAFSPDNYLQNELEASFTYEDTPDQQKSTNDVKKDMEAEYPMDRLICGDVGFGKTEIAIRAAFKAVCDSKQVAVLVPTTILAMQHAKTFKERLKDLPCNVDYINRFKTSKQQKETIEKLAKGEIDIIIGTHRLISKDIKYKDLGLLIIDEEQKFGVAAKEKIRETRSAIDTLTLTATPIPRTLQFSLMGARDLSIINTPPPNRQPIHTEILEFNPDRIRDAIMYEIERGGQAFLIHNKVQNIADIENFIKKICPGIRIAVGHGQMEGDKLEAVILDFMNGSYDLLIATTIIESGLDIPNANTIIINNAQNFGLSDLHQMRGRVGRTNKKAFCYLISPPLSSLPDDARKRIRAIEEFSDLGSGFSIAMRDLDIRGAGNLLGGEQSGFINEMGYETYLKILHEAVEELKDQEFKNLFNKEEPDEYIKECIFESDLAIHIPDNYVPESTERIALYRRIDSLTDHSEIDKFKIELIDRFGAIPKQTEDLFNSVIIRRRAKELGFEKIILKNNKLIGHFTQKEESPYYQSNIFSRFLEYIQQNYLNCKIQEQNNKLTFTVQNITNISEALCYLEQIKLFLYQSEISN